MYVVLSRKLIYVGWVKVAQDLLLTKPPWYKKQKLLDGKHPIKDIKWGCARPYIGTLGGELGTPVPVCQPVIDTDARTISLLDDGEADDPFAFLEDADFDPVPPPCDEDWYISNGNPWEDDGNGD